MSLTKTPETVPPNPKVHPVDEVLPAPRLFILGLQHLFIMYVGAVAVPLIVGGALEGGHDARRGLVGHPGLRSLGRRPAPSAMPPPANIHPPRPRQHSRSDPPQTPRQTPGRTQ